jgi:hypothetical protein
LLLFLFVSCNLRPYPIENGNTVSKGDTIVEVEDTASDKYEWTWADAVRGEPEAILDSVTFADRQFKNINHVGYESATLPNGDKVSIINKGFEYVILEIHLVTTHYSADTTNLKYWSEAAGELLAQLKEGTKVGYSWQDGISIMKKYYAEYNEAELGKELDFSKLDSYRNYVTFDRISRLQENKFELVITFTVGPL